MRLLPESIFEAGRKVAVSKVHANTKNYPFVSIKCRTSDDAWSPRWLAKECSNILSRLEQALWSHL
jgi:hypothetical protein